MSARIAVVDVGLGNLRSVQKSLEQALVDAGQKGSVALETDPDELLRADKVVLPGQGAFRDYARALDSDMGAAVREQIRKGTSYLGICMGLQVLFESSDEAPGERGLAHFSGTIDRLLDGQRDPHTGEAVKIPHMGWNSIEARGAGHPYLQAAGGDGTSLYFVHSYHASPKDRGLIVATARHGPFEITAAVARDNVFACQFHPEKSQSAGLALLRAFVQS